MTERDPFRGPGYGWPTTTVDDSDATPAERALAALKVGAILAAAMTIVLIYVSTQGGLRERRDRISLLVVAAFVLPSLVAYARAWFARRRRAARERAGPPRGEPPAPS